MSTSFAETSYHLIILWIIFAFIGNLTSILLLIFHCVIYYKQEITDSHDKTSRISRLKKTMPFFYKTMSRLTLLSMTGFTISVLIATINHFACITKFDRLAPVFYQIAKCGIYLGFITRLYYIIYNHRITQKVLHIISYSALLKIYGSMLIITYSVLSIWGYLDLSHDQYRHNDMVICKKSHSVLFLICSLSTDTINTTILLTAYIVPVIKTMESLRIKFGYGNYNGHDLKYPVIKISILTSVATFASILAHIISMISSTYIAFLIDNPINVLCVMLMTSYYHKMYEKLCCGLIKGVAMLDSEKTDENMDIANNDRNKPVANKETNKVREEKKCEETNYETRSIGAASGDQLVSINYEDPSEITKTTRDNTDNTKPKSVDIDEEEQQSTQLQLPRH